MFKFLSNWINQSPEEHMKSSLALIGISTMLWGGSLFFPAAAPALLGLSFTTAQLSMVEMGIGVGMTICDGVGWLFNKIFRRKNKLNSPKIDSSKTQSHTHSNDKNHSDSHAHDDILLQRKENGDNGQSFETSTTKSTTIPSQHITTQPLQTPSNQLALLVREISQLRNEIAQLRNQVKSLENENKNLKRENSGLKEKASPSKNITNFLGKRVQNKTDDSLVPSNQTNSKMSTISVVSSNIRTSKTNSH